MMEKRLILNFLIWIVLISSLEVPVISNEEYQIALLRSEVVECGPVLSEPSGAPEYLQQTADDSSHWSKFSDFLSVKTSMGEETESEGKSLDVIITDLQYTKEIYINENQIIQVWSQNISSQTRKLYHKISGVYPDGSPFLIEGFPVEIPPGWTLYNGWALSNAGKGIGFFDFICQVWEEVNPSTKIIHDQRSGRYLARFYRPAGVSADYYCDDMWHHPSDSRILEHALYAAGGSTSPREAAIVLMSFVYNYIIYDPVQDERVKDTDLLYQKRGVCIAFADLYIGLARSINIPTRITCGT